VVLPTPLVPTMATSSPGATVTDTPRSVRRPPRTTCTSPSASMRSPGRSTSTSAAGDPLMAIVPPAHRGDRHV
jgi:hypothetical protein